MSLTDSVDVDSKSEKPVSVIWGKVPPQQHPCGAGGCMGLLPFPCVRPPPIWSSPALMPAHPQGAS